MPIFNQKKRMPLKRLGEVYYAVNLLRMLHAKCANYIHFIQTIYILLIRNLHFPHLVIAVVILLFVEMNLFDT